MQLKNQIIQALIPLLRQKKQNLGEQRRFLILSTTGLGDTLWATPAIRALRTSFPTSYIAVLVSPIGEALLKNNPHIDELFVVKDPLLPSLPFLYRKLKTRKITHALSFHTSQRCVLPLSALLGAQEIVATRGLNKGLDFLLTHALEHEYKHEIERRLDIVRHLGANTLDLSMELFLDLEAETKAALFLKEEGIGPQDLLIGLHPGSKDRFKQWPPSHFMTLGNKLKKFFKCKIIVTGGHEEQKLVDTVASHIPGAISATHLPLLATGALIKRLKLMITNDTGPMHMAFALKTPTIALFTPTDPALCGPYFVSNTSVIAKKTTCFSCLRKKCQDPFCMRQIGVEEVYHTAKQLLKIK